MSNSLESDQAQRFVGSDLGPKCLQRFSADNVCRQKYHIISCHIIYLQNIDDGLSHLPTAMYMDFLAAHFCLTNN